MSNIVLLNVYGMKNIGDAAISMVALKLLDDKLKGRGVINAMFTNKNEDLSAYSVRSKLNNIWSPYGAAIESKSSRPVSKIVKVIRFARIYVVSTVCILRDKFNPGQYYGEYTYISAIRDADMVVGTGGGYIRTKSVIKDFFGLLLTLLPIYVAKHYKKKIVFFPMSFGNFASPVHKWLAYHALRHTTVICRDDISYTELYSMDHDKSIRILKLPDLALYFNPDNRPSMKIKLKSDYIVLTARKWLDSKRQKKYESALVEVVNIIHRDYKLKTIFISMASNSIEDNDNIVGKTIDSQINNNKIFEIFNVAGPYEVQNILRNARFAICTRMHSAILACTVNTPFVCIGYEYKSKGFMKLLDLEEWHMTIENASAANILRCVGVILKASVNKTYIHNMISVRLSFVNKEKKIISYL